MEMIQSFLKDADIKAEKDGMSNVAKTWVKQVREEAYHIEDVIDKYILLFAKQTYEIQGIKKILDDIKKSGERYGFNAIEQSTSSNDAINDTWHDPRMASLFIEEVEVVGIKSHRDKLINWLIEGPSNRMVFSVVGLGGLGKTTLVKKVYDNDKVAPHFDCRAWITVSQSYKMEELLRDMIKQFYKARKGFAPREIDIMKVPSLIEELRTYLREQRGNRIIITTRNEDVAPSSNESHHYYVYKLPSLPFENALEHFCKKAFQHEGEQCPPDFVEFSHGIVERCGGLPLAIVAMGGLFSTKAKVVSKWRKVLDSLSSEFETNLCLRSITRILSFNYHDLPYNLKACFLYFGMFPEDCVINCARLTRLWIAEGFVKEKKGLTLEDVAQDYFNQLIHRSLVQVILSRPEELSFNLKNVNARFQSFTNSQTCSILISGVDELMKVMDCEGAPIDYIPKEVGNLFHLRYLSLRDTKVQILPKSIGKLHNLKTLDLKRSLVSELPLEISWLHKLQYLMAYIENNYIVYNIAHRCAVKIPSGIGCLQSLQKLHKVEANSDALIAELGRLRQLRKLHISEIKAENGIALCTMLEKMINLQSLRINAKGEEEVLEFQSMSSPPPLLQTLFLYGRLEKLPEWIPKLNFIVKMGLLWSRLMDDPLKVIQTLPNLMYLRLYDGYEGEQLHIERGGFQNLMFLGLENLGGLNRLIIDKGALPLLESLRIGPCPQLKEVPFDIHCMKSLQHLEFIEMSREFMISLQPNKGPDFGKVKHIPSVEFWNRVQGEIFHGHDIGDIDLLEHPLVPSRNYRVTFFLYPYAICFKSLMLSYCSHQHLPWPNYLTYYSLQKLLPSLSLYSRGSNSLPLHRSSCSYCLSSLAQGSNDIMNVVNYH
ncbi:hypothetical protein RGQ29_032813 [Quercus rubra]|uniref:Uncharacterized protein n=1 Tax=Quercus rubra TaxID=3512 RepID=A0AAN7DUT9_QUERU|nr:hypothetical protein RGQ29_032813 [Quercus rubra]